MVTRDITFFYELQNIEKNLVMAHVQLMIELSHSAKVTAALTRIEEIIT